MIRRIIVLLAVAVVVLGGSVSGVLAQPALNQQDKQFLAQAHRSNLAEIQAAKLAEQKTNNQSIRAIARRLVVDHTKLDASVQRVARTAGVPLPDRPGPKQADTLSRLSKLSGAAFETAWLRAQIAGHRQSLVNIGKELQGGSSAEVKNLATTAKPIVQGHLEMLQQARSGAGGSPSPRSTSSGTHRGTPRSTPSGTHPGTPTR